MRQIVFVCVFAAAILTFSGNSARAQTVAVGPYYAVPSWDQTIACTAPASCPRFVVLANMNSDAVLDRETGLVWERRPDSNVGSISQAEASCVAKVIGNRKGWRLPTISELQTLVDPSATSPALPDGSPFENVSFSLFSAYWTSTVASSANFGPGNDVFALSFFGNGAASVLSNRTSGINLKWCVRGGAGLPQSR
jgi:hypothetical protein